MKTVIIKGKVKRLDNHFANILLQRGEATLVGQPDEQIEVEQKKTRKSKKVK